MYTSFGFEKSDLDSRSFGTELFIVPATTKKDFYINFDYDCYFNGIEIYAWDSYPGDNVTIEIQYQFEGVWKRMGKTYKNFNIYPNILQNYMCNSMEPKAGMRIKIDYDNKGAGVQNFSLNLFTRTEKTDVNMMMGGEGMMW